MFKSDACLAAWLIFGLTVIHIIRLATFEFPLYGDEAQYWDWAQDLDWGYYSKPPIVAWSIAATTAILGNGEFAVRISSKN